MANQGLLDSKAPLENLGHLERKDPRVIGASLVSKAFLDPPDHLEIKDHLDQLELMESLELLDLEDHQVLMDMLVHRDWLVQQVLEVPQAKKENVEYLENLDLLDHLDHLENLQVTMLLLFLPCLVKVLVRALIHWPRMSQLECSLQTSPMKNARTWSSGLTKNSNHHLKNSPNLTAARPHQQKLAEISAWLTQKNPVVTTG